MADASASIGDSRPLLAFPPPTPGERAVGTGRPPPVKGPGPARQGKRLTPQFKVLLDALQAQRAELAESATDQDPELIVVFDIAGRVTDFTRALSQIDGLEFLAEIAAEEMEADEDFYRVDAHGRPTSQSVTDTLYLVMTNAEAVREFVHAFELWQEDQSVRLPEGLNPLKQAFHLLRRIRRWDAQDRVQQTGLLEQWREDVEIAGGSPARIEIELWYRTERTLRTQAAADVRAVIERAGGTVITTSDLPSIAYHALLADVPHTAVSRVLADGPGAIELLRTEHVMLVGPSTADEFPTLEPVENAPPIPSGALPEGVPRAALLDGLPLGNHDALAGRLAIDDPDDRSATYSAHKRGHGTAMASIIVHGDLSSPGPVLPRPLYVRPVLEPHPVFEDREVAPRDQLLVDVIHRAFRRMFDGEGSHAGVAPGVRVVNLSIGDPARVFVRRLSPLARLIDWLAHTYNRAVVVSAGNHPDAGTRLPAELLHDQPAVSTATLKSLHESVVLRRLLSPAEAINAITVGALHDDGVSLDLPDSIIDPLDPGLPAAYSPAGFGFSRSVKPDVLLPGGRRVHQRPPPDSQGTAELGPAATTGRGPGIAVAAPSKDGRTDAIAYGHGTSHAAALATRTLDQILTVLEGSHIDSVGTAFPDPQYHPVLAKTLLVHAAGWHDLGELRSALGLSGNTVRRELTRLLGYGPVRPERLASADRARVVLVGAASIEADRCHTFRLPLPPSLIALSEWRRLTLTLAWLSPVNARALNYRTARLRCTPANDPLGVKATEADHKAIYKGTVQHQVFEGERATAFVAGDDLALDVECWRDGPAFARIRYGIAASIEIAPNLFVDLYDEVRAQLETKVREREQVTTVRPTS